MSTHDYEASIAAAVIDSLLPSRSRCFEKAGLDRLTNAELFVVLCSSGGSFDDTELKRLATDLLLSRHDALSCHYPFDRLDVTTYASLVASFVDDLACHRASAALAEQLSNQVSDRLSQELRRRFLERMGLAAEAGVLDSNAVLSENTVLPQPSFPTTGFSLVTQLVAAAFMTWVSATPATAADETVSGNGSRMAASKLPAEKTQVVDERAIAADVKVFENSADVRARVRAIERLAALGPKASSALPALRRQLGDFTGDGMRRAEAAWAISYISTGHEGDIRVLQSALQDPVVRVKRIAALALGQLGKAAESALPAIRQSSVAHPDVITCITSVDTKACASIRTMLDREGPLLRLRIEEQLNDSRRFGGGGVCMCSLR